MPRTKTKDPTFAEIVKHYSLSVPKNIDEEVERTIEGLTKLVGAGAFHQNEPEFWSGIKNLVERYFSLQLAKKYTPVSNELTNLKREISVTVHPRYGGEQQTYLQMPLFACARLDQNMIYWKKDIPAGEGRADVEMKAAAPRLPGSTRVKAREAIAYGYEVSAQARRTKTIGDLLTFSDETMPEPEEDLRILWIPRDEDLNVKVTVPTPPDPDPALVLAYKSHFFLVDLWDITEEKPFQHYLREYAGIVNLDPFKPTGGTE